MLELERFKMIRLAEIYGIRHLYVVAQSRRLDKYIVEEVNKWKLSQE